MFQAPDSDTDPTAAGAGGFKAPDTDSDVGAPGAGSSYLDDVVSNAGKELKGMVPTGDDLKNLGKTALAFTDVSGGVPSMDDLKQLGSIAANVPGQVKSFAGDVVNTVTHPVEQFRQKPIGTALNVASVAAPFLAPEAETVNAAREEAALRASRFGQEQAVKSLEGARGQVRQLGPERTRELGQHALDTGIVSPFTPTTLGMERKLNAGLDTAGSDIGAARQAADVAGGAPEPSLLKNNIAAQLTPKYETGMRSGEKGSLQNALDEVGKIGKPSFVSNADKASEMNEYATGNKMLQPTGAFTDVANALTKENNSALQKALTPQQWNGYQKSLSDFGALKDIEKFFTRGEERELAGRGSGLTTDLYKGVKDVVGHKALAAGANRFSQMLQSPAVAKTLPALVKAARKGPGALAVTDYVLKNSDPAYRDATEFLDASGFAHGGRVPPNMREWVNARAC